MRTIERTIYKYNELSEKAQQTVMDWWLQGKEAEVFDTDCNETLQYFFDENNLDYRYSLGYSQGDGFSIYGTISLEQFFNCLKKDNLICQAFNENFSEKDKKTLLHYASICGEIEIEKKRSYSFNKDSIDFSLQWIDTLKYYHGYRAVNIDVIFTLEKTMQCFFDNMCRNMEKMGYDFFYTFHPDDVENYEFYENGEVYIS